MMHMHAPQFSAAVQRRKDLAGVEQQFGIEGAFDPLLLLEIGFAEHVRHQVSLFNADAMLAGQHPADLDAQAQDVVAEFLGPFEFARIVGVVKDERVQIPVAESLESSAPLAATLLLRSMIDYALDRAKSKRYGHAARHLQTCGDLAKRIEDFGEHPDHDAYVASLKARHGRKSGFWGA